MLSSRWGIGLLFLVIILGAASWAFAVNVQGGDSNLISTKQINSRKANTVFYDFTGNIGSVVITDQNGFGQFKVINSPNKGWSIWVPLI